MPGNINATHPQYTGSTPDRLAVVPYNDDFFESIRRLNPTSDYAMAIALHDSLVLAHEQLAKADIDPESGLPGKETFYTDLERNIKRLEHTWSSEENLRAYGLYMWRMDGDDMKELNTEFGPEETDRIFAELGRYIKLQFRPTDGVYRPNRTGDEFWVLMPTQGPGAHEQILRKVAAVYRQVSHSGVMHGSKHTFSIGVAQFIPGMDPEGFIQAANEAQSMAKAAKNMPNRPAGYIVSGHDALNKPNIQAIPA